MKSYLYSFLLIVFLIMNFFCRKDTEVQSSSSSLTLVDAIPGSHPLYTNFTGSDPKNPVVLQYYSSANVVGYGGFIEFSSFSGATTLSLSQTTDSLFSIFRGTFNLPVGGIQTLFITGDTTMVDTLFTSDNIPYHNSTDSTMGIRFVNLVKGSSPVTFDIYGNSTGPEVANLPYKGITQFKNYNAAGAAPSTYIFECRDATTGNVLSNQCYIVMGGVNNGSGTNTSNNNYRFRNFTIALIGQPPTPGGIIERLILVENY